MPCDQGPTTSLLCLRAASEQQIVPARDGQAGRRDCGMPIRHQQAVGPLIRHRVAQEFFEEGHESLVARPRRPETGQGFGLENLCKVVDVVDQLHEQWKEISRRRATTDQRGRTDRAQGPHGQGADVEGAAAPKVIPPEVMRCGGR